MDPLRTPLARSVLALVIGFEAFRALFAPLMVVSYRSGDIGVTQALGGLTPGDDYRRFIPLMDTVPGWLLGFCVASGVLLLAAAWRLARGRTAFGLFASAYALSLVASWVGALDPRYSDACRHAFIFAQFNLRRDVLLPVAGLYCPSSWESRFGGSGARKSRRRNRRTPMWRANPQKSPALVISLRSAFKLSFECIDCPECQFGGYVHVSNARLQLQKILPCTILVSLGTGLVTHADDHTQNAGAPSRI